MTRLVQVRPMLDTKSVNDTVAFYTEVLGFTCTGSFESEPGVMSWAGLEKDDVRLMFNALHTHEPGEEHDHEHPENPVMTGSIYFNVDDVDALATELGGKVDLAFGPQTFPHGMREIGFPDNNGYFLVFGTPVDPRG